MTACTLRLGRVVVRQLALPATSEVWIRMIGMLLLLITFFYFQAARHELTKFIGGRSMPAPR